MSDRDEDGSLDESSLHTSSPSDVAAIDTGSFSEWLSTRAESTGQSESEILKQLVAAYWQLYEHVESGSHASIGDTRHGQEGPAPAEEAGDASAVADLHLGLGHSDEIQKLECEIDELREHVEELRQRSSDADQDAKLQKTVDRHASQLDDLESLTESLAEAEAMAAQALDQYHALSESQDDLRADHTELQTTLDVLEDAFVDEIRNARTVLEHLLETVEQNEAAIDALQRTETTLTEHSSLVDLKLEALQFGADTASCEECGEEVVIPDLTAPECPACTTDFTTVSQDSEWFGLRQSHTLHTANTPDLGTNGSRKHGGSLEANDGS